MTDLSLNLPVARHRAAQATASFRRYRGLRGLTAVLVVAVLGTNVWLLSQRTSMTTVELEDALERFRAGRPPAAAPGAPSAVSLETVAVADPAAPRGPCTRRQRGRRWTSGGPPCRGRRKRRVRQRR